MKKLTHTRTKAPRPAREKLNALESALNSLDGRQEEVEKKLFSSILARGRKNTLRASHLVRSHVVCRILFIQQSSQQQTGPREISHRRTRTLEREKGKDENVGSGKKGDGKMLRQTSGESERRWNETAGWDRRRRAGGGRR